MQWICQTKINVLTALNLSSLTKRDDCWYTQWLCVFFSNYFIELYSSCSGWLNSFALAYFCCFSQLWNIIKGWGETWCFPHNGQKYCSSVWSNTSVTNINQLQAIQNFALRIVTRSRKFVDNITPILKQLRWMAVRDYLFYRDALLTFKCMNGMAPSNLSSRLIKRGTICDRSTRNANLLDIPRYNCYGPTRLFIPRSNHLEQLT